LKKAFCEPGNVTDNGILSFCRYVIIPVVLRGDPFIVERAPENGGNVEFNNYEVCLTFSKPHNKFPTKREV
jgi:tyrosyl-tRNA synthetase